MTVEHKNKREKKGNNKEKKRIMDRKEGRMR
jgi:hypothetical protein